MAKAKKNNVEQIEGIMSTLGARMLDAMPIPASAILTWDECHPNFDNPTHNVGRDVEHSVNAVLATAVSLLSNGQFVPVFTCPQGNNEHVLIDGERRVSAARAIMQGFDYEGRTYPPQSDFTLVVRSIVRDNSEDLTLEQVKALGRFLNTDRSMVGVSGFMSLARTASSLKAANPDATNRHIKDLMVGAGHKVDDSMMTRFLQAVTLPVGMQDQIFIGENSDKSGIGYSALQPWLKKSIKQPNDDQWAAFFAKTKYTITENEGRKNAREIECHDLRGEVIASWYGCKFDLVGTDDSPSPFKKWKPDGKKLPEATVKPKVEMSKEDADLLAKKQQYAWKTFLAQTNSKLADTQIPPAVKVTVKTIVDTFDRMVWSTSRNDTMTAEEAAIHLIAALNSLTMGTVDTGEE